LERDACPRARRGQISPDTTVCAAGRCAPPGFGTPTGLAVGLARTALRRALTATRPNHSRDHWVPRSPPSNRRRLGWNMTRAHYSGAHGRCYVNAWAPARASGGGVPQGACHQAGVDEREGLAEQLRTNRARLDQIIDGEAADDA